MGSSRRGLSPRAWHQPGPSAAWGAAGAGPRAAGGAVSPLPGQRGAVPGARGTATQPAPCLWLPAQPRAARPSPAQPRQPSCGRAWPRLPSSPPAQVPGPARAARGAVPCAGSATCWGATAPASRPRRGRGLSSSWTGGLGQGLPPLGVHGAGPRIRESQRECEGKSGPGVSPAPMPGGTQPDPAPSSEPQSDESGAPCAPGGTVGAASRPLLPNGQIQHGVPKCLRFLLPPWGVLPQAISPPLSSQALASLPRPCTDSSPRAPLTCSLVQPCHVTLGHVGSTTSRARRRRVQAVPWPPGSQSCPGLPGGTAGAGPGFHPCGAVGPGVGAPRHLTASPAQRRGSPCHPPGLQAACPPWSPARGWSARSASHPPRMALDVALSSQHSAAWHPERHRQGVRTVLSTKGTWRWGRPRPLPPKAFPWAPAAPLPSPGE